MSVIIEMERLSNSLQTALLASFENDDFEDFKHILLKLQIEEFCTSSCPCSDTIDINHVYANHENKTLLDIACSSTNKAALVKYLLQHGADVNLINRAHGEAPIHFAVSHSDFETVKLLVEHKDIDIHQPNTAGLTAFHLAAQRKHKDIIKLLQGRQAFEIEQAKIKVCEKRSLARYKYNTHDEANALQTSNMNESSGNDQSLASLLKHRNYKVFKCKANADNVRLVDDSLGFTYLQYACKFGLIEFVQLLLDLNVDPNQTGRNHMTPITLAAYEGYYDIVQLLQNTGIISYDPVYEKNILHFILCGYEYLIKSTAERLTSTEKLGTVNLGDGYKKDHAKCLKLILDNVPHHQLDVDEWDERGNTPLHYAIVYDNRDMILSLIERGAYIGVPNHKGDLPITLIQPATLEYLLDESMWTITNWNHYNRTVFNYDWLICREQHFNHTNEMDLLKALSEVSKLRPLLKHPFFLVLLDFKWHIIVKKLFYIDLSFYILFIVFFSLNELILNFTVLPRNLTILGLILPNRLTYCSSHVIITCNTFMLLKELAQLIIYSKANKYDYVTNPKNYMEITLITIVYVLSLANISAYPRAILVVPAIFLSYVKLILLISNHPVMSEQIEMFKVVAWSTFKCLMSYGILILAFAVTFFLLFRNIEQTNNAFREIFSATFKTLIMSTGEYDITDTLNTDEYGVRHLVVILFMFFIHIVLLNLLNAIAVSDIQGVREEAELISIVARIRLIAHTKQFISILILFPDILHQLFYNCINNTMCGRPSRNITHEKQYYPSNYFGAFSNSREIIYKAKCGERGTITKQTIDNYLQFAVSPSTEQSIREKISAKSSKEEIADARYKIANVARARATSQEVCESLTTLITALDENYEIVEPMLTEITKLSRKKSK